jgi:hypothetical protein
LGEVEMGGAGAFALGLLRRVEPRAKAPWALGGVA